jgi:hypothetical protein
MPYPKRKLCELTFAASVDPVIKTVHAEDRHANDMAGWVFGFLGRFAPSDETGTPRRWRCVYRIWKVEALLPGKDAALVALVERATGYGFASIEVYRISPPPSLEIRATIAQLNEQLSRMKGSPCGEGTQSQENQLDRKGLANLAVSTAL